MRNRVILFMVGLIMIAGPITTASAFDLNRAKTEAEIMTSGGGDLFIQLEFSGELINGLPDLTVLEFCQDSERFAFYNKQFYLIGMLFILPKDTSVVYSICARLIFVWKK